MVYGFENCQILKISDNEIQLAVRRRRLYEGVNCIFRKVSDSSYLLTMGKEGSVPTIKTDRGSKADLLKNAIETTGAGDTFCGCVLHYICEHGINGLKRRKPELKC